MKVEALELAGIKLITPRIFGDERGFFFESYQADRYREQGINCEFVQDNHSCSARNTLRGLHYQATPGQAKLIRVIKGKIFDVAVDIRLTSPTFGKWLAVELDAEQHRQFFVPVGFAHGFCVLSEVAEVLYKVSSTYDPSTERCLAYDDEDIGVEWPVSTPLVSERDRDAESLAAYRARVTP